METNKCSKCGSAVEQGRISIRTSPFWKIGFTRDSASKLKQFFGSAQQSMRALACSVCGHIELILNSDIS